VIFDFSTARSFGEVFRERSRRAQEASPSLDSVKEDPNEGSDFGS
jgi:hypothetical protein